MRTIRRIEKPQDLFCSFLALAAVSFFAPAVSGQVAESKSFVLTLPADGVNDSYGEAVARGDFNGDGFDDLAAGQPSEEVDGAASAGAVYIYYGQAGGLEGVSPIRLTQPDIPSDACEGPELFDNFGAVLAVGDYDGNGLDDIAVAAPGERVGAFSSLGAVSIIYSIDDPDPFFVIDCYVYGLNLMPGVAASSSTFGLALATGNFNSDSYDDLAVGAPGATVDGEFGAGTVTIMIGDPAIFDPSDSQLWHQNTPGISGISEAGDGFGSSLATGDLVLGLDVACDLAVGTPFDDQEGATTDGGSAQVIFGCTPTGLSADNDLIWHQADLAFSPPFDNWRLGRSLAIGNFDCTGAEDLAIGIPGRPHATNPGSIGIVYGDQTGPVTVSNLNFSTFPNIDGARDFTDAMLAFSFSGDSCDDLVVSAPGSSSVDNSTIYILEARESLFLFPTLVRSFRLDDAPGLNSSVGASLAGGRFDGTETNLAAGAASYSPPGGDPSDGGVWILPSESIFADGFESGNTAAW